MAVYTPTDKRFRRAHVRPSKRRRVVAARRRVVRGLGAVAVLSLVAYWTPDLLSLSPFLQIDTIVVQGNRHLSNGEVLALVGQLRGENILQVDLEANRTRLLTSGWVKDATLRRLLPSAIEVMVEERTPVGLGRFAGSLYLIDEVGTVIDEHGPAFSEFDLPIIDGLATSPGPDVEVDGARAQLAARLITELEARPDLAARVSQINVRDSYDAVVLLSDDSTLIHLGYERFVERLQAYLELAPGASCQGARHRLRRPALRAPDLRTPGERRWRVAGAGVPGVDGRHRGHEHSMTDPTAHRRTRGT